MCFSVDCHQQSSALFCNRFWRISRYTKYRNSTFFCNSQVNAVKTSTTKKDCFDAQFVQCANCFCRHFIVNERTSCIMTSCHVSSCWCQSFIEISDFIAKSFNNRCEELFPIGFCVKKSDFHVEIPPKNKIDILCLLTKPAYATQATFFVCLTFNNIIHFYAFVNQLSKILAVCTWFFL